MRTAGGLSLTRFAALVLTLTQRDLKARFKGTLLGWLWSLILPLATLGLYAIVFGLIFRAQVEPFGNGHPAVYVVWLFVGLITFSFFSSCLLRSAESLRALAGVLNRVRVPALAPIIAALISVGLQSLVEFGIYLVVLAAFMNIGWTWLLLPLWGVLFFVFTAGIAAAVAIVAAHIQDFQHVLGVLLQFLFFATPVMYPLTMIPADLGNGVLDLRAVLGSSPLAQFVDMSRRLLYDLAPGTLHQWLGLMLSAVVAVMIGGVTVHRWGADVAERVQ